MKKMAIVVLIAALATGAFAADNWVEVTAKGQGPTRDKAIQNGLYLAVCQVQGVAVSSRETSVDVSTGDIDVVRDPQTGSKKIEMEGVSANLAGTLAVTEAKGLVRSFEIVDEKQVSADAYEVNLKVKVYDYQSPEDAKKLRVAIFPLDSTAEVHRFGGAVVSGRRLGEQFSQYISAMLARNEKFTLLDRQSQDALAKEKKLLTADAPLEEKARLGEVIGADYVLVGTIAQAELKVEEKRIAAINDVSREFTAYMDVEYKLLVGPTRQVAMADQLRFKLEDAEVKALAEKWKSDDIDYNELEQKLVQIAAGRIADGAMDYLYPVRVAAVREDGTLILNQGGNRFAEGDVFAVSNRGDDIIDPETGKSLGKDEMMLGELRITKVLPRISYAEVVSGKADVGGICRRQVTKESLAMPAGRQSGARERGSGGVRMPFDNRESGTVTRDR